VTRLWDGWLGGLNLSKARNFSCVHNIQTGSTTHPASCLLGIGFFFSGVKQPEHEVDHLHVLLRLRVSEAVLSLLLYTFMACMGTALPIFVYLYLYNICLNFFSMFQMCAVAIVAKSQKDFLVILRRRIWTASLAVISLKNMNFCT
jgi:26S proteasome regulatory complex component